MMHKYIKIKPATSAFTMIEMVMAIVVLGILAALAIPRMERDIRQEAADHILSSIRYTQHLALLDKKHRFNDPNWQRAFWRIQFESCNGDGIFMSIGSDMDLQGDIDKSESATDPSNGKAMFWQNTVSCPDPVPSGTSDMIFLTKKYNITGTSSKGSCNGVQHIGFDHLGRPHVSFSGSTAPDYSSYMRNAANEPCIFTFTSPSYDDIEISIQPETGYAQIVDQDDS